MKAKAVSVFHWLPRILCMLAILFISLFAADSFAPGLTLRQQLGGFFMHLIPSFILIGILIIAWKWELVGGIMFIALGIFMSPSIYQHNLRMNHSIWMSLGVIGMITLPFVLVGTLFIVSHTAKKKR